VATGDIQDPLQGGLARRQRELAQVRAHAWLCVCGAGRGGGGPRPPGLAPLACPALGSSRPGRVQGTCPHCPHPTPPKRLSSQLLATCCALACAGQHLPAPLVAAGPGASPGRLARPRRAGAGALGQRRHTGNALRALRGARRRVPGAAQVQCSAARGAPPVSGLPAATALAAHHAWLLSTARAAGCPTRAPGAAGASRCAPPARRSAVPPPHTSGWTTTLPAMRQTLESVGAGRPPQARSSRRWARCCTRGAPGVGWRCQRRRPACPS
jgi:hypothetical protein